LLLTPACGSSRTTQFFLDGTQPVTACTFHTNVENLRHVALSRLEREYYQAGAKRFELPTDAPLTLDLSFLTDDGDENDKPPTASNARQPVIVPKEEEKETPDYNYLLD
jgi:hypothetical protein